MFINNIASLSKRAVDMGIPLNGMFELTERCNLHCKFCYVCDRTVKAAYKPEKTAGEWLDMIHQAVDDGMLVCTFTGGEPFIREDFEEIYCKAYDMGLRIAIFTNATLIGEKQRSYLRKRPPGLISISLYGASEESYRELCGNGADYHLAMNSIEALSAAGFHIEIKAIALRPLMHELEAIGHVAAVHQCAGLFDIYLGPGRDDRYRQISQWRIPTDALFMAQDAFQKESHTSQTADKNAQADIVEALSSDHAISCLSGKKTFHITSSGRMTGCSMLTCFTADPFVTGFTEAWKQLKDQIKNAQSCNECNDCPVAHTCHSCPAKRLHETGTITKCSPYLKDLAYAFAAHIKKNAV